MSCPAGDHVARFGAAACRCGQVEPPARATAQPADRSPVNAPPAAPVSASPQVSEPGDRSRVNGPPADPSLIDWLLAQAAADHDRDSVEAQNRADAVCALVDLCTEPIALGTLTGGNTVRLLVPRSAGTRRALQLLALAYAHRPGYLLEWAP